VCADLIQIEKYKKAAKKPQPHMKPSMKIEMCMVLIQEFS